MSELPDFELSLPTDSHGVVVALHGAWHLPQCFDAFREKMDDYGYAVVSPGMPIDNPELTYVNYADLLAIYLRNYANIWILAHSRATNVAPLLSHRLPSAVKGILYLCGAPPPTYGDIFHDRSLPPKHVNPDYERGIRHSPDGLTSEYDPDIARSVFLNDMPQEAQDRALAYLRPQRSRLADTVIGRRPRVIETVLYGELDMAVNPDYCRQASLYYLGKQAVGLATGHSPFISHPKLLSEKVVTTIESGEA